ncbi:cellulose-binding protein [Streptomyces sp. NPDC057654]|uniref:cellulose-binding protein n=1 Tax=Streptomyces sp. NPDC057654 TaxID=3346196 RepID=UPI003694D277
MSPHGFAVVRGRGYRIEQVDRALGDVSHERDTAWERAARLTVLAKEMEAEAERLREVVANLAPQTYESLGGRAADLLAIADGEAAGVRGSAEAAAEELSGSAADHARAVHDAAAAYSASVRTEAEEWAEEATAAAQHIADDLRAEVRREVKDRRAESLAALKDMRQRTAETLAEQEKDHSERWDAAGRELAGHEADTDAHIMDLEEYGRRVLAESQRAYAEVEESIRHGQEDAEAQAESLVSQARSRAERVERETERVLREHEEERDELRAHMVHVRSSLAALTGKAVPDPEPASAEAGGGSHDAGTVPGPASSSES